ncbi:hypothetical protein PFDG_04985 [Plasmodium falciparum Dd2]|uniref:Uncharacterized protein n=1 Tax=Plasmodium falciparum (isolate Dd2) TaxID=57267 RepID=A0A0L7M9D8_PLAF4|nr:hypothetical protein PFDG_04985 [Plasmodium falciparum Dd2]
MKMIYNDDNYNDDDYNDDDDNDDNDDDTDDDNNNEEEKHEYVKKISENLDESENMSDYYNINKGKHILNKGSTLNNTFDTDYKHQNNRHMINKKMAWKHFFCKSAQQTLLVTATTPLHHLLQITTTPAKPPGRQ